MINHAGKRKPALGGFKILSSPCLFTRSVEWCFRIYLHCWRPAGLHPEGDSCRIRTAIASLHGQCKLMSTTRSIGLLPRLLFGGGEFGLMFERNRRSVV